MTMPRLRTIDLQDVLPYMPNPVDGDSLENMHRDLTLELDKISFLTEVLRDKIHIVDENIATVDAKGDSEAAKKIKAEVEAALKKLAELENTVSQQAGLLSQAINRIDTEIADETLKLSEAVNKEIADRTKAVADEAAARAAAIKAEQEARIKAIADAAISGNTAIKDLLDKIIADVQQEVSDRTKAVNDEIAARKAAIKAEADTRAAMILQEQQSRTQEIAAEAKARSDGILAEANARANAIAKEQGDRATEISTERSERISGDQALSRLVTTLTSNVKGNTADLKAEQKARADSDSALSQKIDTLSTSVGDNSSTLTNLQQTVADNRSSLSQQISTLTSKTSDNEAAITAEQTARTDLESSITTKINNLVSKTDANSSRITQEAQTRTSDIDGISKKVDTLTTAVGDNGAAITSEQQARVSADNALSQRITTLTSTVNGNTADIKSEQKARADQDSAFSSRLDNIVASIGNVTGELDNYSFDKGKQNWSTQAEGKSSPDNAPGTIVSVQGVGNVIELSGRNVLYYGRAIPVQTDRSYRVRIRVFQSKDGSDLSKQTVFAGVSCLDIAYQNLGNRYVAAQNRRVVNKDGWIYLEGIISGVSQAPDDTKFIPNTTFAKPMFIVNGGGGNGVTQVDLLEMIDITDRQSILSAIQNEADARVTKDNALANQINSLSSEISKNGTSISAIANRVTKTEADVKGKASVTDFNTLSSKVNTNTSSISGLVNLVTTVETDVSGKADVSSVNSLSSTVRKHTSDINGAKATISANSDKITKISTDLAGKASSSDVSKISAEVTSQGKSLNSLSSRMTTVTADLANKASVSDFQDLSAKVTSNDSDISSLVNRMTTAESDIAGKASISSVNTLSTKINTANSSIAANARSITQVKSDIANLATSTTITELTAKVNKNTADLTEEKRVRTDAVSSLTSKVNSMSSKVEDNVKNIQSAQTQLTSLNTAINGKAAASDVNTLTAKANDNATKVNALTSRVTKIETDVKGKASASAVNSLSAKVDKNRSEFLTEKNALVAKDEALSKRVDSVVSSVESLGNQVVNFDFEFGKQAWSPSINGEVNTAQLGSNATVQTVAGEGKVLQVQGDQWFYYGNAIPVDTSRKYKMRVKVRQTVDPTNGSSKDRFYAGVATLDSNYNNQTGGAGTHRYFVRSGYSLNLADGWQVFEAVITGEGSEHANFRPNTAYVKPMMITNYSGGNGTVQIAYIKFWDATDEIENKAAITTEQKARSDEDRALGSRIDTISTQVRSKVDNSVVSALATKVTNVESLATGKADASTVNALRTTVNSNSTKIANETKARTDADASLGSRLNSLTATVNGKAANSTVTALSKEVTNVKSALSGKASASSVKTLQTQVGRNTASVRTLGTSLNGVKAQYAIKTQATTGGTRVIAGIGVLADASKNISEVAVMADNFFVIPATRAKNFNPRTDKQYSPFLVSGNSTYIKDAYIRNGAIDTAKIKDASIVTAKIANLSIDTSKIKNAAITNAKIANVIQSNNYIAGRRGWKIDKSGTIEASDGIFRGTVYADKIDGDVVAGNLLTGDMDTLFMRNTSIGTGASARTFAQTVLEFSIRRASARDRYLKVEFPTMIVSMTANPSPSGTRYVQGTLKALVSSQSFGDSEWNINLKQYGSNIRSGFRGPALTNRTATRPVAYVKIPKNKTGDFLCRVNLRYNSVGTSGSVSITKESKYFEVSLIPITDAIDEI